MFLSLTYKFTLFAKSGFLLLTAACIPRHLSQRLCSQTHIYTYRIILLNTHTHTLQSAVVSFKKLHAMLPENTEVMYQLATCHDIMQDYEQVRSAQHPYLAPLYLWCAHHLCVHCFCAHRLCVHHLYDHRLCVHGLCAHNLCVHHLCVDHLCAHHLCAHHLCAHRLCGHHLSTHHLCVSTMCALSPKP